MSLLLPLLNRTRVRVVRLTSGGCRLPLPLPLSLSLRVPCRRTLSTATATPSSSSKPLNGLHVPTGKEADTGAGSSPVLTPSPASYGAVAAPISGQATSDSHKSAIASDSTATAATASSSHADVAVPSIQRADGDWTLSHPIWHADYLRSIEFTHLPVNNFRDRLALATIRLMRFNFDWMSGYTFGPLTERKAVTRMVFLETVAGVPGSVAATLRHLASLRRMKRDGGWINTLMAEAENERMHLLTALEVRQPGRFMRLMVFLTQGIFFNFFWVAYLLSPRFCHRLVGYLEEEAVVTYTKMLQCAVPGGSLASWNTTPAPPIAVKYWNLQPSATMKDVIAVIRADEAHHRDVNHTLGSVDQQALNPFRNKIA